MPTRYVIRVDPDIRTDIDFADQLSIPARALWFESLFYLAAIGEPDGFYPHTELVRETGREADEIADQLVRFGIWDQLALGYKVHSYQGCGIRPESRASIPNELRLLVYRRDGYQCATCGAYTQLTLDHIIPWSLGGSDDESNLQTMCRPCNSSKGNRGKVWTG